MHQPPLHLLTHFLFTQQWFTVHTCASTRAHTLDHAHVGNQPSILGSLSLSHTLQTNYWSHIMRSRQVLSQINLPVHALNPRIHALPIGDTCRPALSRLQGNTHWWWHLCRRNVDNYVHDSSGSWRTLALGPGASTIAHTHLHVFTH